MTANKSVLRRLHKLLNTRGWRHYQQQGHWPDIRWESEVLNHNGTDGFRICVRCHDVAQYYSELVDQLEQDAEEVEEEAWKQDETFGRANYLCKAEGIRYAKRELEAILSDE